MTTPWPQIRAELGVSPAPPVAPAGTLVLDDPALGLLDTGTLCGATAWTDTAGFIRTLQIIQPGSRVQGPMWSYQAGTVTVTYDNADGRFDPDNIDSPYVPVTGPSQVQAMIPFRVRATYANTDYDLIMVFADGWQDANFTYDQGYSEFTLTATDAFKVLAGITLPQRSAVGAGETSGARISRILNAAGWFTDHRRIAAGDSTVQATTFGSDVLSLLQLTADTELGELYMDGSGNLKYRNRHAQLTSTRSATPQGVFGDLPGTVHPAGTELACAFPGRANDDTTLVNDVQITAAGSSGLQEAQDAASIAASLFPRSFARSDLLMQTDFEALAYAQWILCVGKSPEDRFDTLVIDPLADPVNLFPQVLGRQRGDRIQVWRRPQSVPPVVSLYGSYFPPGLAAAVVSSSGHTFGAVPVPGWGFGAGVAVFYSRALPDGQIALTTVGLTENELKPTFDHAELAVFTPPPSAASASAVPPAFTRIVIPTSAGATTVVTPGEAIGGTDAGGGDMVVAGGKPVFTCEGYYFNWNIPTYGLYPVLGFLKNQSGQWGYDAASSLTADQWEATNPTAYATIAPSGQATGVGANYWPTRGAGQMAVLPNSGRIVMGHYFGTGSFTGGVISVSDNAGNLLVAYQVPNITPTDGTTITTAACRDVQADPTSAVNDERIVILYDAFGTGSIQQCWQEFSYNESTKVIAPVTMPTCPTDTTGSGRVRPIFSFFGSDGTLYISTGNGLSAANLAVYVKHGGGRNTEINAPVTGSWPTTGWPTAVFPDYSLGFPIAQGLGALAGPMAQDPNTGAVLMPGNSIGAAVPVAAGISAPGPNLLAIYTSGLESANLLTDDDNRFASSLGTWTAFLAVLARNTSPPVAPPAGTVAAQMTPAFGSEICQTGRYPVIGGQSYQSTVAFLAGTVSRTCETYLEWLDGSGAHISNTTHGTGANNNASWTALTSSGTAPSNAASVIVWAQADSPGAGESHYFAACALYNMDAPSAGWTGFVTNAALTSDQALDGKNSLAIIAAFNSYQMQVDSSSVPVTGGREYLAKASFRAKTTPQRCPVQISWFDANGNSAGSSLGTLIATNSTSGWVESWCGARAPDNAVTAKVSLKPFATAAGEVHYADRISLQAQPFTSPPAADYGVTALRQAGYSVITGRPSVTGGTCYVPVATVFTGAENSAYNSSYVPDSNHPQYLAGVSVAQLLAGKYGAVVKDCFIRGIQHDDDAVAGTWATTWTLQDAAKYAGFLVLDSVANGLLGSNKLAY